MQCSFQIHPKMVVFPDITEPKRSLALALAGLPFHLSIFDEVQVEEERAGFLSFYAENASVKTNFSLTML